MMDPRLEIAAMIVANGRRRVEKDLEIAAAADLHAPKAAAAADLLAVRAAATAYSAAKGCRAVFVEEGCKDA